MYITTNNPHRRHGYESRAGKEKANKYLAGYILSCVFLDFYTPFINLLAKYFLFRYTQRFMEPIQVRLVSCFYLIRFFIGSILL